ncbi:MAG: hypothetical protein IMW89_05910, partial [Ktedonobacteraceae bacterium]|nr:hypothetical protein [Ktedonobacteraceae bacterium]
SDLGIALPARGVGKSTQADRIGTAAYAAPEQFRGLPCFASDQYALGVMVYEWLCGVLPFTGSSDEVAWQHMNVPPLPLQVRVPHLSLAVERVVLKALAKEPGERFDSVEEFALALEQACEDDREVSSQPGSPPQEISSKGDAGAHRQEAAQGVEVTIAPGSLLPPQDGERASDEAHLPLLSHLPVFSLLKKTLIIVAISVASELIAYAVLAFLGVDMRSIWLLLLSWLFALPLAALAASEQWNMLPLASGILLIAVACGLLFHSLILFCIVDCLLLAACLADGYLLKKRPNC